MYDIGSLRCRQTFRGHTDSVNGIAFQHFGNQLATCSADKTISVWDLRSGLSVKTFYSHKRAVNSVSFSLDGPNHQLVSADADGVCKIWDLRIGFELLHINTGVYSANAAHFDQTGRNVAIACGDSVIRVFDVQKKQFLQALTGHGEAVHDCVWDRGNQGLISVSADKSARVWKYIQEHGSDK